MATQDEVNRACEALAARGERPTVERVRTALGGGSPNSLTPQVRLWNDARRQLALAVPTMPLAPAEPGHLPMVLQRALNALTVAYDAALGEVMAMERRQARVEIEAAAAAARKQVDDARLTADDERQATEAVRGEAAQLEQALTAKAAEIAALAAKLEAAQATIADLGVVRAVAEQKVDSARQRAERAEAEARTLRDERMASEAAARDAIARAAKAEGEIAALHQALDRARQPAEPATNRTRRGPPSAP